MKSDLDWEKALGMLGEILEFEGITPVHLVACGGAAMLHQRLVDRVLTKDVDVIGTLEETCDGPGEVRLLESAEPAESFQYRLPSSIVPAVARVARDLGVPKDWLNARPADVVRLGLPEGATSRLHTERYRSRLAVSFLDRYDLIHLKLHAALDRGGGRHLEDLRQMRPTPEEIASASRWCLEQDPGLQAVLREGLNAMGFHDGLARLDL